MTSVILQSDFKTLRHAYIEVKSFIEKEAGEEVSSLDTRLEEDMGCSGDDNWELLEKFIARYNLDATGFDYSKHFLSEGEIFGSESAGLWLISLPIVILLWMIKILSIGKIDCTKKQLFPDRQTMDLSFGDMLTWYLTGKYNLRSQVTVRLRNS
jgi:hypothetical protein